jgi:hypothetical protein
MQLSRVIIFLAVAVLLLVSHQLILSHNYSSSQWLIFKPQNAKINTTVLFMVTSYAQEFTGRQVVRETYLSIPSNR